MPGWTCSSSYGDQFYSLRMCPHVQATCGDKTELYFTDVGSKLDVNMVFYAGQVCVFTIRSKCGAPAFKPDGLALTGVDIYTIEYDDADVVMRNITVKNTSDTTITFPIPVPSEKFKGKQSGSQPSQLINTIKNANGTVT